MAVTLGQEVDLDLGLGARGAHHNGGAVGQVIGQDVGPHQFHLGDGPGGGVPGGAVLVVLLTGHRGAGNLYRGRLPEGGHDGLHVGHPLQAGHHQVQGLLPIVAVLLINGLQGIQQGHPLAGIPGRHLREQEGGGNCVLVPDIVPDHVSNGLLVGEDHMPLAGGLQLVLLLRHKFKAGEGAGGVDVVDGANFVHHLGGDDGGQSVGVLTQRASTLLCANEVVQQQHTSLVAGEDFVLTLGVAHHHAHSVGVRIAAHNEVTTIFLGQLHCQGKPFRILRIGGDHRGEVAVNDHLFRHAQYMLQPQPF